MRGIVFCTSPIVFQAESTKTHLEETLHINSLYHNLDPGSYVYPIVPATNRPPVDIDRTSSFRDGKEFITVLKVAKRMKDVEMNLDNNHGNS